MNEIEAFGYIGISSGDLDAWIDYASTMLGMAPVERCMRSVGFRMDDRKQRLIVDLDGGHSANFFGWQVRDAGALDSLARRLELADVPVVYGNRNLAERRFVEGVICFSDPFGNRIEAFHGPWLDDRPFVPGRAISGFRTGALGMGHIALNVERIEDALPFYRDLLGFRVTDYAERPLRAYFLNVNQRHHSLALIENGRNELHHLMLEVFDFDDVGQCLDIANHRNNVAVTLGRHINDLITGFYSRTPADFLLEYGWGGRLIGPADSPPKRLDHGYSLWGHERSWLEPEAREEARQLRMNAAEQGIRAKVQVMNGNHDLMPGDYPHSTMVGTGVTRS